MFIKSIYLILKEKLISWFKSFKKEKISQEERKRLIKQFQKDLMSLHRSIGESEFDEFRRSYEFRMVKSNYTPANLRHAFQRFRERKSTEGIFFGWIS